MALLGVGAFFFFFFSNATRIFFFSFFSCVMFHEFSFFYLAIVCCVQCTVQWWCSVFVQINFNDICTTLLDVLYLLLSCVLRCSNWILTGTRNNNKISIMKKSNRGKWHSNWIFVASSFRCYLIVTLAFVCWCHFKSHRFTFK